MQTTLKVSGLTCEHCDKQFKKSLESLNGVFGVEVHLDTGNVDVTYDASQVTIEMMREATEEQGYDVSSVIKVLTPF
ncbi:MAG TPA: cation transporter [Candidatus Dormibacteraeota bacterium]|nr:cation transporter [Candidatus Dormibacteraeota bacterium]